MIYIFLKGSLFSFECGTAIYMIVSVVGQLQQEIRSFPIIVLCISGVIGLCMMGFGIFLWILFGTHIYLILTNQTTAEYLKNASEEHPRNPFGRSANQDTVKKPEEVLQFAEKEESHASIDPL
jgi:hypothetical protein